MSLIRRSATIEVELERMEGRLSVGESVDLDQYVRAVGHLRRVLETLGIERAKRDVTPRDLHEYLTRKAHAPTNSGSLERRVRGEPTAEDPLSDAKEQSR